MELGEPDESGRRRPVPIKGSEHKMKVDTAIIAVGEGPNPLLARLGGFKLDGEGHIIVDENNMTSIEGVFAGGDISNRAGTVIDAMGGGKRAAVSIDRWLKEAKVKA